MGRIMNGVRDTARVVGRYATLENFKKSIGIGQNVVNIIEHLKGSSNPNVRKIVNKVPVDNIQTALDIGKGVHHLINTRIYHNPTSNDYTAKVLKQLPAQRRPTALSNENQAVQSRNNDAIATQIAMNMRHTGR